MFFWGESPTPDFTDYQDGYQNLGSSIGILDGTSLSIKVIDFESMTHTQKRKRDRTKGKLPLSCKTSLIFLYFIRQVDFFSRIGPPKSVVSGCEFSEIHHVVVLFLPGFQGLP